MEIIGLRIEKYVGTVAYTDDSIKNEILDRFVLCATSGNKKYEISLWTNHTMCGSGWTTATYGNMEKKEVLGFAGISHIPKNEISIKLDSSKISEDEDENDDIQSNNVFSYSKSGSDPYYPSGFVRVQMELFKETIRTKDRRLVWIFQGPSNVGKSTIASKLDGLSIYETDSLSKLPDVIFADVIVLGNKYPYSILEVSNNLFENPEIHVVSFI